MHGGLWLCIACYVLPKRKFSNCIVLPEFKGERPGPIKSNLGVSVAEQGAINFVPQEAEGLPFPVEVSVASSIEEATRPGTGWHCRMPKWINPTIQPEKPLATLQFLLKCEQLYTCFLKACCRPPSPFSFAT